MSPLMSKLRKFQYSRRTIALAALSLLHCASLSAQDSLTTSDGESNQQVLITTQFPADTWAFFSGKKDATLSDSWNLVNNGQPEPAYLACKGHPYGYIRTKKKYDNFVFGLEWRFPTDPNGNSGILLYTSGDDRIWPKSLQVQLHQPVAGSTFPSGGAKSDNELRSVPPLSRPLNQWNRCLIHSLDGTVTVTINDQKVGEVTGCDPQLGAIALQSEGSEIHFRKVWIRELKGRAKIDAASTSYFRHQRKRRARTVWYGSPPK